MRVSVGVRALVLFCLLKCIGKTWTAIFVFAITQFLPPAAAPQKSGIGETRRFLFLPRPLGLVRPVL